MKLFPLLSISMLCFISSLEAWGQLEAEKMASTCPHQGFLEKHICDTCRTWRQATKYLIAQGVTGVSAVFGPPPPNSRNPLFRMNGYSVGHYCLNRQPRAAYRCNIGEKRKYCFKIGSYCYGWHNTVTGELNLPYINCVDNYTTQRQHQNDDYDTNRQFRNEAWDTNREV